jgi:hypothetical protein
VRNGYIYQIDARERTRRVSGALTVTDVPIRSRASQAQAGGPERRASDDGKTKSLGFANEQPEKRRGGN